MDYPQRDACFAHKFTRLVFKSCLAQDIGHKAVMLLIHVVHTEDASRYSKPVTFWNSQLLETLGLTSEKQLRECRDAAVAAGWLQYVRASRRHVGQYFVTVPELTDHYNDQPIEEAVLEFDERTSSPPVNATVQCAKNTLRTADEWEDEPPMNGKMNRRRTGASPNPIPEPNPLPFPERGEGEKTDLKTWPDVADRLRVLGVLGHQQAIAHAFKNRWSIDEAFAVIAEFESKPEAWTAKQLYDRFRSTNKTPSEAWPPPSAKWQQSQQATKGDVLFLETQRRLEARKARPKIIVTGQSLADHLKETRARIAAERQAQTTESK